MSVYYTTKISREEAIRKIIDKKIEKIKKVMEHDLSKLTNRELAEMLDSLSESEFENFNVIWGENND